METSQRFMEWTLELMSIARHFFVYSQTTVVIQLSPAHRLSVDTSDRPMWSVQTDLLEGGLDFQPVESVHKRLFLQFIHLTVYWFPTVMVFDESSLARRRNHRWWVGMRCDSDFPAGTRGITLVTITRSISNWLADWEHICSIHELLSLNSRIKCSSHLHRTFFFIPSKHFVYWLCETFTWLMSLSWLAHFVVFYFRHHSPHF